MREGRGSERGKEEEEMRGKGQKQSRRKQVKRIFYYMTTEKRADRLFSHLISLLDIFLILLYFYLYKIF